MLLPALLLVADQAGARGCARVRAALAAFSALPRLTSSSGRCARTRLLGWGTLAVFVALAARVWRAAREPAR